MTCLFRRMSVAGSYTYMRGRVLGDEEFEVIFEIFFGDLCVVFQEFGTVAVGGHMTRLVAVGAVYFVFFTLAFVGGVMFGTSGAGGFGVGAISSRVVSVQLLAFRAPFDFYC